MIRSVDNVSADWGYVAQRVSPRWFQDDSASATSVHLPHCWNTQDTFADDVVYRQGWGSYRRRIVIPAHEHADDVDYRLRLEGFYGFGDVWVNGRRQGKIDGAYLGARIPLPECLGRDGTSVDVGLRLCNNYRPAVLPGIKFPDFLLYGGLSGRAWLEALPRTRIADDSLSVRTQATSSGVRVDVNCACLNGRDTPERVHCRVELLDDNGYCLTSGETPEVTVAAGETAALTLEMPDVVLDAWGIDHPVRYRAVVRLFAGEHERDMVSTAFGHRRVEFRPREGLFLNGERVFLKGVNRHECMPGLGSALPLGLHKADALKIKAMGLNCVRLSHYPQHPAFLDACDELGILVYAELSSWKSVRTGRWLRAAERQLTGMILRDRHHPSVFIWGLGNEGRSLPAYRCLKKVVQQHDPTRPVSYAENHLYRARRKKTLGFPDVWGMNYEFDVLDEAIESCVSKTVLVTECSNSPETERGTLALEEGQVTQLAQDLDVIEARPEIIGFTLWCYNDYATMRKERYRRFSGVVDAWREPKMSATYLQARFGLDPVLVAYANWGCVGGDSERDVYIVTNLTSIKVTSGSFSCVRRVSGLVDHLRVPFTSETLRLESAESSTGHTFEISPNGEAACIQLVQLAQHTEAGDVESFYVFQVSVVDANGIRVSDWSGSVAIGTDDATTLCAFTLANEVDVRGGSGRLFLRRPKETASEGFVTTSHPSLQSADARLP
ncbi:MAG: beta-galactosidase [Candidatus Promineifilaceae bacterium]|jgi:beta-galactosidase